MTTFDTPRPITATLDLNVADVRLTATERTDTVVEVRPRNPASDRDRQAAEQTRVEYADGSLLVRSPKTRAIALFGKPGSIDVEIALPAGSRVHATAALGGLDATGTLGDVRVKTATGDVSLERTGALELTTAAGGVRVGEAAGDVRISTATGRVEAGHVHGGATVKNSNGYTGIGRVDGALKVSNANGDITVRHAGGDVTVTTANGSVRLEEVVSGTVSLQTAAGSLHVGVAQGTAAWLDLNTLFGKVRSELEQIGEPEQGERAVQVRGRTSMGNIDIVRAAS
ncbi:DUF4097 family beta strand repeat-containing protein [Symbioplanes lichenis]|uniref:DUF4097 family beta strand repeat-containing protein n=1 Tax=Symbioplanes lichenis TaxID=1629072 RepID=UPI0027384927|nr:DUF4097 family beta strand repeat-containing protein [Actinoplanes lichenis]